MCQLSFYAWSNTEQEGEHGVRIITTPWLGIKDSLFIKRKICLPSWCMNLISHFYMPILRPTTYKLVHYIAHYLT